MKFLASLSLLSVILLGGAGIGSAKTLSVITTTEDLAAITRAVGGNKVDVEAIAKGYQDPHFVEAKPSYLIKLRKADLLIAVGLELEVGWLPVLVKESRNPNLIGTGNGYLEASQGCEILEKPAGGEITRALGDIHPYGNPHCWLSPHNGRVMAENIARKLSDLMPEESAHFSSRLADFEKTLDEKTKAWKTMMAPFRGTKVVTYHNSWPNFAEAFGLDVVGYIEPKPGVPPSPSHTLDIIRLMKEQGVKLIIIEPYFDVKLPQTIARDTGATLLILPPSVGGEKGVADYFSLYDCDIGRIVKALSATR